MSALLQNKILISASSSNPEGGGLLLWLKRAPMRGGVRQHENTRRRKPETQALIEDRRAWVSGCRLRVSILGPHVFSVFSVPEASLSASGGRKRTVVRQTL